MYWCHIVKNGGRITLCDLQSSPRSMLRQIKAWGSWSQRIYKQLKVLQLKPQRHKTRGEQAFWPGSDVLLKGIVNSPSCRSKPGWLNLSCRTRTGIQKKVKYSKSKWQQLSNSQIICPVYTLLLKCFDFFFFFWWMFYTHHGCNVLYIVANCHFFSVVTWKDIITCLQNCEGCTHFCEMLYVCVYIYIYIYTVYI